MTTSQSPEPGTDGAETKFRLIIEGASWTIPNITAEIDLPEAE